MGGVKWMELNRRTFQQTLLMGAAWQLVPLNPRLFALSTDWRDLAQPFASQIERLLIALDSIGEALPPAESTSIKAILSQPLNPATVGRLEAMLAPRVLLNVDINPESRVSVTRGAAKPQLIEHGWRTFLIRVNNQAKDTSILQIRSPQGGPMGRPSGNETDSVHDFTIGAVDVVEAQRRWLAIGSWDKPPLQPALSGLAIEYRILQLYSRDHGLREASLEAVTGAGVQDLGYRSTVAILFQCSRSQNVKLRIRDTSGNALTVSLIVRDNAGRIYPPQSKRALPDLWFQPQIYRGDSEVLSLPPGSYSVECSRGPEYLPQHATLDVNESSAAAALSLELKRWVLPSRFGYYSGDSHIHAAGCSHYESPSEGVTPEVMLRQVEGEALDVGAVLTWAPGFLYQSQFFSGHVHDFAAEAMPTHAGMQELRASTSGEPILRYDIEVSGFPSSHCGHLVLLKLKEQKYPGTTMPDDWPSWNLPIMKWAKSQGAIVGYAHSGHGMVVDSVDLPNYLIPPFDSCGANEYLVDVTHEGMLDFISGCDLWPFVELNLWYQVLNCGFNLKFAGETDFPCITDRCVGGGRSYVKLDSPPAGDTGYAAWLANGLQHGDSYFGDGRSHIFNMTLHGEITQGADRHWRLPASARLRVTAEVCAWLEPEVTPATEKIRRKSPYDQPYWHIERARVGMSRKVPVELIVNGFATQRIEIEADGGMHPVAFEIVMTESSWIGMRVLPSSHTNPMTVLIASRPIRASRKSAIWCRQGVDICWKQKAPRMRANEIVAAQAAYDHARAAYERIFAECRA